jgi:hypothetical protein
MVDPVMTQRAMRAGDDERADLSELLDAPHAVFAENWFSAAEVHARCYPDGTHGDQILRAAMRCDDGRHISPKTMGRRLKTHSGRAFASRRLEARHNPEKNRLEFRCAAI